MREIRTEQKVTDQKRIEDDNNKRQVAVACRRTSLSNFYIKHEAPLKEQMEDDLFKLLKDCIKNLSEISNPRNVSEQQRHLLSENKMSDLAHKKILEK